MAWIKQVSYSDSRGLLRQTYDAALARAGRIWKIVQVMSLRPKTMQASMQLYIETMMAPSDLSRIQREMLATVVSSELQCKY